MSHPTGVGESHPTARVLEIGLAYGISPLFLCDALDWDVPTCYHVIDPHQARDWLNIGLLNLARAGYADAITFHEAPSATILPKLVKAGLRFDFALVDGSHRADRVLFDVQHVDQLLEDAGMGALDDIQLPAVQATADHLIDKSLELRTIGLVSTLDDCTKFKYGDHKTRPTLRAVSRTRTFRLVPGCPSAALEQCARKPSPCHAQVRLISDLSGSALRLIRGVDTRRHRRKDDERRKECTAVISVIVPVRNAQPYVSTALRSILEQEVKPHEIIVVDANSSDGSGEVAATFPDVAVLRQQGQGLADARNFGVRNATGEMIAFLDADDFWPKHRLRVALAYLEDHPHHEAVIGQMVRFLEPGVPLTRAYTGVQLGGTVRGYTPGACLARRTLFNRIGGFDDNLKIGCDSDWFVRMHDAGIAPAVLAEVVLHKRIHTRNLSANTKPYRNEFLSIVRNSLERRRTS